ncbi:MAG: AAA family ATPase [Dehalococcoidia bacterium]|jgi:hypothetical protein
MPNNLIPSENQSNTEKPYYWNYEIQDGGDDTYIAKIRVGDDHYVRFTFSNLHQDRADTRAHMLAENVKYEIPAIIAQSNINLTNQRKEPITNSLKNASFVFGQIEKSTLEGLAEEITSQVVNRFRYGDPSITLRSTDEIKVPEWLVKPLIWKNKINTFYGREASLKGYLVTLLALIIGTGWDDNPFGFKVSQQKVLYVDWEDDEVEASTRQQEIARGMGLQSEIEYLHCTRSLEVELPRILKTIREKGITVVVIDSLSMGNPGDPNGGEIAQRGFAALRKLGCTAIVIAHTSKTNNNEEKTVLGSVLNMAFTRNAWYVDKQQESNSNTAEVTISHSKANRGGIRLPFRFKFAFTIQEIRADGNEIWNLNVTPMDVANSKLARDKILDTLKQCDDTNVGISQKLVGAGYQISPETVKARLHEMKLVGDVVPVGQSGKKTVWALATRQMANIKQ